MATYELGRNLFDRAYLLEDALAQEASVLDRVLEDFEKITDYRRSSLLHHLFYGGNYRKKEAFNIRQHSRLKGE